jgi:hypothetical protein
MLSPCQTSYAEHRIASNTACVTHDKVRRHTNRNGSLQVLAQLLFVIDREFPQITTDNVHHVRQLEKGCYWVVKHQIYTVSIRIILFDSQTALGTRRAFPNRGRLCNPEKSESVCQRFVTQQHVTGKFDVRFHSFNLYTPVVWRDVLWYGTDRPYVCPSVRPSVRPSVNNFLSGP